MKELKWVLIFLILLIAAHSCGSAALAFAGSSTDDWFMFRHDSNHSGTAYSEYSFNSSKLLWTCPISTGATFSPAMADTLWSSPAIADGYLVIGSKDHNIYGFTASNGHILWNYTTDNEVSSSPAISDGRVYVGSDDGYIYCLDVATGERLWACAIGGFVGSSPAVLDGCVFVGSGAHDVFCLNASNGSILWRFPTSDRILSSPAVCNGTVYVACNDENVYALNASTGSKIWSFRSFSAMDSPCIWEGYVYTGSYVGCVYAFNASTGSEVWRFQAQDTVFSSPAVAYGYVYAGSDDGNVYCLDALTGRQVWQAKTGYWVRSSPAIAAGNVYVGSADKSIYCFDAFTGEKKWSYATGNHIYSSPAVANGTLFVYSEDRLLYAFALCNSTAKPPVSQFSNSLPFKAFMFDLILVAVCSSICFIVTYFVYRTWRIKQESVSDASVGGSSWLWRHFDAVCILVILAFSLVFFAVLGWGVLWEADEKTYTQMAFHIFKTGDYLNPYAFGGSAIWAGKPPLVMWLMSFSYQVFGVNNFAARFWGPIFGVASMVVLFYLGKKLYNTYAGILSAIVFGTFFTFVKLATHAMLDVPLVFFILASIYFYLISEEKNSKRYAVLSGLFFGLAFMTKLVAAFFIPLIIFAYLAVTKRSFRFLFTKRVALFLGVAVTVFSPWLLYMNGQFGSDFWTHYFVYSTFARATSAIEGHVGSYLYYFNYLVTKENTLWVILLPFATASCLLGSIRNHCKADTLILLWMFIVLAVFTFAHTKIEFYILPAIPAFALAIGNFLQKLLLKADFPNRFRCWKR